MRRYIVIFMLLLMATSSSNKRIGDLMVVNRISGETVVSIYQKGKE